MAVVEPFPRRWTASELLVAGAIDAAELDTGLENVASLVIPHRPILPQPSQQASKAKNVEPAM